MSHEPVPAAVEIVDRAPPGAPALVLVHGATQDRRTFSSQVPALAPHWRLVLVDLPGHGASSAYPGPYDLETHWAAVLSALDAQGLERFHFFGTHTGAGVGLMLLARCAHRLRSAVLEGPVLPDAPPPSVTTAFGEARAIARRDGIAAARAHWFETAPWFRVMRDDPERCRAGGQRAIIDGFGGSPWLDVTPPRSVRFDPADLARVPVPVLILNGERDVDDFLELAPRVAALVPGARMLRIDGGGGFPHWEVPDAVNGALIAFLQQVDGRA